jgi:hypothetical protein
MPLSPDRSQPVRRDLRVTVAVLIAAGYGLTLSIFYPGVMTYDAKFVYEDIAKGLLGDWQSPVMTVLWSVIDPVAPGAGSMFLLIATSYWLGFGLRQRRRLPRPAARWSRTAHVAPDDPDKEGRRHQREQWQQER